MNFDNLAFLTHRPQSPKEFTFAYCTTMIGDQCVAANKTEGGGNSFQFPLYVYQTHEDTKGTLFTEVITTRRANLAQGFIQEFRQKLGMEFVPDGQGDGKTNFGPEDVFYYAYSIFHAPTYRQRYAEFLKIDFPRLPLTSNKELFLVLVRMGKELVDLHLLKSTQVNEFITSYPVAGDDKVENVKFALSPQFSSEGMRGNVYINSNQYFGEVPEEVWNFKVGGYQVCEKWLKDRKGRSLSGEDISHYQQVVVALKETIRLMGEIDEAIPGWPIQ